MVKQCSVNENLLEKLKKNFSGEGNLEANGMGHVCGLKTDPC